MEAMVIGATGATGKELVKELLADVRFSKVSVFVRTPQYNTLDTKLVEIVVDFEKLQAYQEHIRADVAFSCLGSTIKSAGSKEAQWRIDYEYQLQFAQLAFEQDVPSFVLLSSAGANAASHLFYNRMKGSLEDAVKKIGFEKLLIFQPGMIERPNTDRIGEQIGLKVLGFFNKLGLLKAYSAIHTSALAKAMLVLFFGSNNGLKVFRLKEIKSVEFEKK